MKKTYESIVSQWFDSQPGSEVVAAALGDVDHEIRALLEGGVAEPTTAQALRSPRLHDYKIYGRLSKSDRNLGIHNH